MKLTLPALIPLRELTAQDRWTGWCLVGGYFMLMVFLQQPISINNGLGWDGYHYYQMAGGDSSTGYFPLWLRYGLPWLAGRFPTDNVLLNFKIINLSCALLHAAACYVILVKCAKHLHGAVPIMAWVLVCAGNLAPIPSVLWYPVQTDPVCNLFSLLFLIMMITGRVSLLLVGLLFFAGTAVRENFPEFLLYSLLGLQWSYDRQKSLPQNIQLLLKKNGPLIRVAGTGLIASIAGLLSIFYYTGQNPLEGKAFFAGEIIGVYRENPYQLLAVLTNTISAMLFIVMASFFCHSRAAFGKHLAAVHFAKPVIVITFLIAVIGGTNPERYLYWSMPFYVLCLLPALHNLVSHKYYLPLSLCLLWAVFIQRSLVPIDLAGVEKDCGVFAILAGQSNWIGHWSDQCDGPSRRKLVQLAAAVALLIALLTLFTRWFAARRRPVPAP